MKESLTRICGHQQSRGVKGKHGKHWAHATLNYMLLNPAYKRELYGNKHKYEHDPIAGSSKRVMQTWRMIAAP